jgi:hypothetical protein
MGRPRGPRKLAEVAGGDPLTIKQRLAVLALASGKTCVEAAADVGVTTEALRLWRADPAFRSALEVEIETVVGDARQDMRRRASAVVESLVGIAISGESEPARVAAAREVLSRIGIAERTEQVVTATVDATVSVREAVASIAGLTPDQLRALAGTLDDDVPGRDP